MKPPMKPICSTSTGPVRSDPGPEGVRPWVPRSSLARRARALVLGTLLLPLAPSATVAQQGDGPNLTGAEADPVVASAVDRALRWLAKQQNEDGSWTGDVGFKLNQNYEVEREAVHHVGVTALCGMAFLAGGHLPGRGEYGKTLTKATDFVLSCADEQGFIARDGTRMYSHAFSTLFLAEVAGMSRRSDLRDRLQHAVDLIVQSQNSYGSWRYEPFAVESDMSITVCQIMALRAARYIGIKVPKSTIDRAVKYVKDSFVTEDFRFDFPEDNYYFLRRGSFRYQQTDNTRSSYALTAAGIASLYNAGVYSNEILDESLEVLWQSYDYVRDMPEHYFFWYGNYYAVQAFYIAGDRWWPRYWERIRTQLLKNQSRDGNWRNTVGPGDAFSTAIASIILQVNYRYLPILQK